MCLKCSIFIKQRNDLAEILGNLHNYIISEFSVHTLDSTLMSTEIRRSCTNFTGKVFLQPTGSFRGLRCAIIGLQLLIAEES